MLEINKLNRSGWCGRVSDDYLRGIARIFQKGRGGGSHTVSNIIVMAFLPRNIVGCLLKKSLTKGGSHGHPKTPRPLATPLLAPN